MVISDFNHLTGSSALWPSLSSGTENTQIFVFFYSAVDHYLPNCLDFSLLDHSLIPQRLSGCAQCDKAEILK